ncbi:hypothetical protein LINPERPRIM_LOCUS31331, partial [Linum perenne]
TRGIALWILDWHFLNYCHSFSKQIDIVLVCCALHNFIRMHAQGDSLFVEFEESDG